MPDQPPARRTQQARRETTERTVLAAATAQIARHGSRTLTLAAVGEAAGYSRGIVTHHFGSRENLLRAVMRDARTFTLPDPGESAADWLADTVRAYLKNVTSRRPAARADAVLGKCLAPRNLLRRERHPGGARPREARRVGQLHELGWAATYLCSPYAAYVSGHTFVIDGGYSLF